MQKKINKFESDCYTSIFSGVVFANLKKSQNFLLLHSNKQTNFKAQQNYIY